MKVVTTPQLVQLARTARHKGFNRLIDTRILQKLDPQGLHVLSQPFIHGDVQCIRCTVVLLKLQSCDEPVEGMADFDIAEYNRIPEYKA